MRKAGFTFLELLIALSLFTVGMISVLEIFPVNRRFIAQSGMLTQASMLAQEEMEIMRSDAYSNLTVGTSTYYEPRHVLSTTAGDPISQFERRTEVEYVDPNTLGSSNTDQNLKRVETIIYWNENGNARSYTLDTYVYQ